MLAGALIENTEAAEVKASVADEKEQVHLQADRAGVLQSTTLLAVNTGHLRVNF